jgi:hypothetical protein
MGRRRPLTFVAPPPGDERFADHQLDQTRLVQFRALEGRDPPAAAHDRHPIAVRENLPDLVRDEDDRQPLAGHRADGGEERVHFLRGQHGGGLVEDKDVDAPVERLEDLDLLLDAGSQPADLDVQLDGQPEAAGHVLHRRALALDHEAPAASLAAQQDVLEGGEVRDQLDVLVDHADPVPESVDGRGDAGEAIVDSDLAAIGAIQPTEDVHQRGLARAVLAQKPMDLSAARGEVDVMEGDRLAKALGDPRHVDLEGPGHGPSSPRHGVLSTISGMGLPPTTSLKIPRTRVATSGETLRMSESSMPLPGRIS